MHLTLVSEDSSLSVNVIVSDVANIRNVREELNYLFNILPFP